MAAYGCKISYIYTEIGGEKSGALRRVPITVLQVHMKETISG